MDSFLFKNQSSKEAKSCTPEVDDLIEKKAASTVQYSLKRKVRRSLSLGTCGKKPKLKFTRSARSLEELLEASDKNLKSTQKVVEGREKDIQDPSEKSLNKMQYVKVEQLSEDQEIRLIRKIKKFKLPLGMSITNYMFFKSHLEICYLLQGDVSCDESVLHERLSGHLNLNQNAIKLTKLKGKPIYKETLGPGEPLSVGGTTCALGALVTVHGKGIHALTSGHGKQQGEMVYSNSVTQVGTINVAMSGIGVQNGTNDNTWYLHRDVALIRLDNPNDYVAHVGLKEDPGEAKKGMRVKRYSTDGREGEVHIYMRTDFDTNVDHRYLGVTGDDGGPIHVEGESGTLIVKHDESGDRAEAVGMLTETVELPTDPARGSSLAVHMTANFTALRDDQYCDGSQIQFVQL